MGGPGGSKGGFLGHFWGFFGVFGGFWGVFGSKKAIFRGFLGVFWSKIPPSRPRRRSRIAICEFLAFPLPCKFGDFLVLLPIQDFRPPRDPPIELGLRIACRVPSRGHFWPSVGLQRGFFIPARGLIRQNRPFSAIWGVFFEKVEGGERGCIIYRGLTLDLKGPDVRIQAHKMREVYLTHGNPNSKAHLRANITCEAVQFLILFFINGHICCLSKC